MKLGWMACGVMLATVICGCGPQQPMGQKEFRRPKPPPAVPAIRREPINQSLRAAAKKQLIEAFNSDDAVVRANAVEAAQNTLGDGARDIVAEGLLDKHAVVRFAAAMAAGRLGLHDLRERLLSMADDASLHVQIGVRFALHKLGDPRFSHDLEKTARHPSARLREDTAFVLGLLGEKSALKVLRQMASDPDSSVRVQVAEARWRLGDEGGLEVLVAGTISQFADERMLCLMGLVGPKDRRVADHVRGKLTDDYTEVALVAARCMGELGYDDGYTVATNSIRSADPRQRLLAAVALGAIGRSDAQNTLAPLLNDPQQKVRVAAATALLQLKEPS